MARADTRDTAAAPRQLLPARDVDVSRAPRIGAIVGIVAVFVAAVGMTEAFEGRILIAPWIGVSDATFVLLGLGAGIIASRPPPQIEGFAASRPGRRNVAAGALAGLGAGAVVSVFVLILDAVNIRSIFVAFTPRLSELMTFDRGLGVAIVLWFGWGVALGTLGGLVRLLDARWRRGVTAAVIWVLSLGMLQVLVGTILDGIKLGSVRDLLYRGSTAGMEPGAAVVVAVAVVALSGALRGRVRRAVVSYQGLESRQQKIWTIAGLAVAAFILAALPQVLGNFLSAVLGTAGTFLLMALGLNIVIGFAGLLDLGYVAFFAVGAYTTAVLTSPTAPTVSPELTFWTAIPFVIMAAALAGLVVGSPVLRMRGDYLAIVTLGFGEIARLIVQSDWQRQTLGGAQGIKNIPAVSIAGFDFVSPENFFYLILAFALIFTYITYALQRSRLGRAWNAMREDEPVAEAMGVNIVTAKLWAFVLGAIMAALGGAMFSTKVTTVFPNSFNIVVSITIVVIVIVGGLGSVGGVVVGALVLVGLPELLREFEEFKFLLYGMLLIFMMLKRPEGFIPSRRRQRELHEEELSQDTWLRAPAPTGDAEPEARG